MYIHLLRLKKITLKALALNITTIIIRAYALIVQENINWADEG